MSAAMPNAGGRDRVTLEDLRRRADAVADLARVRARQGAAALAARGGVRVAMIGAALVILAVAVAYQAGRRHGAYSRG